MARRGTRRGGVAPAAVGPRDDPTTRCSLCGRPFALRELTKHHCLPREKGGTPDDVALLCRQCHGMVHATYTNATLAALYPTIALLRQAPELAIFIKWVRKQPPSRRTRNAPRRRKI
jgi:5-methylcytosine-specific restriction endonuclease McrA